MTWEIAKENKINWIIRSGRNNIDFNYELELAAGNNFFWKELETLLIIPDYKNIDFSSRLIKQKGNK
jgi:pantetheine-phosphate adenylyltransferase